MLSLKQTHSTCLSPFIFLFFILLLVLHSSLYFQVIVSILVYNCWGKWVGPCIRLDEFSNALQKDTGPKKKKNAHVWFWLIPLECLFFLQSRFFSSVQLKVKPPACVFNRRDIELCRFEMVYFRQSDCVPPDWDRENTTTLKCKWLLKQSGKDAEHCRQILWFVLRQHMVRVCYDINPWDRSELLWRDNCSKRVPHRASRCVT